MNLLYDVVANILAAFYAFIPNYAVAITLLTILVMAITTPLTLKSTRSMMVMQQLQPEMKKIQARYKDDRQKQNEELLKFYKENNINPLGGCIPLIVQMPVFFFLYQILRGLTRRVSDLGFAPGFNSGQSALGANVSTAPTWLTPFDPAYLDHNSALYQSLQGATTMNAIGMDLSQSLLETWSHKGALASIPYILLIVVVAFTSFYQQRQIQGRNPDAQINPQQQTLMKIMPVILPLISLSLPAGLVLYFAVSNLWRVGLQGFISRSIYGIKRGERPAGDAGGKGSGGKGGGKPSGKGGGPSGDGGGKGGTAAAPKNGATKTTSTKNKGGANQGRNGGGNGRKKQPATTKASSRASSGARAKGGGGGRPDTNKKRAGNQRSTPASRSSSGGGGNSPTLQPRARKPKKR